MIESSLTMQKCERMITSLFLESDLHDFVLAKPKLFVLIGQNTIAKQKKNVLFCQNRNKTQNRAGQLGVSKQAANSKKYLLNYDFIP